VDIISAIIVMGNDIRKVNSINKKYQRLTLSYGGDFRQNFFFPWSINKKYQTLIFYFFFKTFVKIFFIFIFE